MKKRMPGSSTGLRPWARSSRRMRSSSPPRSREIRRSSMMDHADDAGGEQSSTATVINMKAMTIRRARLCLYSIRLLRQAVANAMHRMQQGHGEWLVDHPDGVDGRGCAGCRCPGSRRPRPLLPGHPGAPHGGSSASARRADLGPIGLSLSDLPARLTSRVSGRQLRSATLSSRRPPPWARRSTASMRAESSGKGEGLDQIIVGAGTKPLQAVVQLVAGGEHDHRGVAPCVFAQAPAQA